MKYSSRWGDKVHPSGDTKPCAGCGGTIIRKNRHTNYSWLRVKGCSNGCVVRSRSPTLEQKLSNFVVNPTTGCHIWQGTTTDQGIPRAIIWFEGKLYITARVMWEFYKGSIPDGLFCCHECDNGLCVNLDHIFLGTHLDNMRDMVDKGRQARQRGSKSGMSILTEELVMAIIVDPDDHSTVAEKYGVAKETIDGIRRGNRWQWLTGISKVNAEVKA